MTKGPYHNNPWKCKESEDTWVASSDAYTIKKIREFMGLPPIKYCDVNCRDCGIKFKSQFAGKKRIEYFCAKCHYHHERTGDEPNFKVGGK